MQSNLKTKMLGATGGALVLAMAAGGVAYASTPSSVTASKPAAATSTVSATHQIDRAKLRREVRRVLRHTVHAQLIVHTKGGFQTLDIDRGVVVSDSSKVLTIKRSDGPTVSATITGSTQFYGLTSSHIVAGDRAEIVQTGGNALLVASRAPKSASSTSKGS
jgi:hypothetical protein